MSAYESPDILNQYLLFHYGELAEVLPYDFGPVSAFNFPVRCVIECLDTALLGPTTRALDIGCAVGRSTFELARYCDEVIGIDFSQQFIQAAQQLQTEGELAYQKTEEGHITTPVTATIDPDIDRSRMEFEVGDAQDLRSDLGQFDVVLAANLLCRLPDPRKLLDRLPELVKPQGQVLLMTPTTWLEEYTPVENWLGGFYRDGLAVHTLDTLQDHLQADFRLTTVKDLPFLIREHVRKFQWSVSQASCWIRRG